MLELAGGRLANIIVTIHAARYSISEMATSNGQARSDGSIYFTDSRERRIRRVNPDGIITTVAGNGTVGSTGDGGPATAAAIAPTGAGLGHLAVYGTGSFAIGPDGSIYFADGSGVGT